MVMGGFKNFMSNAGEYLIKTGSKFNFAVIKNDFILTLFKVNSSFKLVENFYDGIQLNFKQACIKNSQWVFCEKRKYCSS